MSFETYLEIVRSFFFPSFGEVAEALVEEFFVKGVPAFHAALMIGDRIPPEVFGNV